MNNLGHYINDIIYLGCSEMVISFKPLESNYVVILYKPICNIRFLISK